jgi:hypothetical protein
MVKSEKTGKPVWLKLRGYHVVALKSEFGERAVELERAIQMGIPAYPDLTRADFYDVQLEDGWAYIHVYRDGRAVYLVAYPMSPLDTLHETAIEPVLSHADAEGLPCYVETFNPGDLPLYKELGFRIEGAGQIPEGPNFWAMVRAPRMQSKAG